MVTNKTSSSAVVVHSGEHLFNVVGHSKTSGRDTILTSDTFRVGGRDWAILYYPNGDHRVVDNQLSSVFIKLMDASSEEEEVMASFSLCLQDPAQPATGEKHKFSSGTVKLSSTTPALGTNKFVSKADLATSGCLKDDCLVIKCTLDVPRDSIVVLVPPSNLTKDLRSLLESGLKADITIRIGRFKRFKAHACVLAARSPVFRAQLCSFMRESRESSIRIHDMNAHVFKVMLHYMYNDCLPEFMEEEEEASQEARNMTQHLLVAANRYAMERLKVMCESKLSKALDIDTVASILDLAETYDCEQLKVCCLKYMATDGDRLRAIRRTDGFLQLQKNHPLVASDILDEVVGKLNPQDVATSTPR